jgi:uncharacterized YigZ family protein
VSGPVAQDDRYLRPAAEARHEERIQRSRFLARVLPLREPGELDGQLADLRRREHNATHHCSAWRCGHPRQDPQHGCHDDGEPAGSAGQPILQAIEGSGLSDLLVVVTRWYGGVKLGTGGLVRAYGGVARQALALVPAEVAVLRQELHLRFDYPAMTRVQRLLDGAGASVAEQVCGTDVALRALVPRSALPALREALRELFQGRGRID